MRDRFGSSRGFALIVTLTLLSFIVLLIVGLATYSRVEIAVAGNVRRQAEARENALFALNIALGELQKHAGVDRAVTATAEGQVDVDVQKRFYTGVWSTVPYALPSDPDAPLPQESKPLRWLVSGANTAAEDYIKQPLPTAVLDRVTLVGNYTVGSATANATVVETVPITAPGVPGVTGNATIGRYAWWVGDQGVKAPVAITQPAGYASHLFSQGGPAIGAATGSAVLDSFESANAALVTDGRVLAQAQLGFLRQSGSSTPVGLALLQQNYRAWSPNNFAVLADTIRGGLKRDLSLDPSILGTAFAAWSNYRNPEYMEPPTPLADAAEAPVTDTPADTPAEPYVGPRILPEYDTANPLRRRYRITPAVEDGGAVHSVAPVLISFGLSFSVHEDPNIAGRIEVSARCNAGLWNPYTSALMPEALKIEVSGLPSVAVRHNEYTVAQVVPLADYFCEDVAVDDSTEKRLTFLLPVPGAPVNPDEHSWLPGRVYNWASVGNTSRPSTGNEMTFHQPDISAAQTGPHDLVRTLGQSFIVDPAPLSPPSPANSTRSCLLPDGARASLTIRLLRARDDAVLATYTSPSFTLTGSSAIRIALNAVDFAFVFRMPDLNDGVAVGALPTWLTTVGADPRSRRFSSFTHGSLGDDAGAYGGETVFGLNMLSATGRLLEREAGESGQTFDKDAPVFELPRTQLLSLGALQHLRLTGARPFTIGNPWGDDQEINGYRANSLFDRFFFSGLIDGIEPPISNQGDIVLPNFLLKPLRKSDAGGSKVTAADLRLTFMTAEVPEVPGTSTDPATPAIPPTPAAAGSRSSKFLLQAGAFNLNSTNVAAWASVLSGLRFTEGRELSYLNASELTGTEADSQSQQVASPDAHFFRFSQSAGETYRVGSDAAAARTAIFRNGVRQLTPDQVNQLATGIVNRMKEKHAAADGDGGPFRSLEQFLSRSPLFAGGGTGGDPLAPRSLLEAAIEDSGLNSGIPEFSSQWLTQADIMSALAPTLFPRSDTFVIRTYGEALNPVTGATEGRAWCEAIVQRLPEYFADPATYPPETLASAFEPVPDPNTPDVVPEATEAQTLNKALGRRFKVVSFRWLTRADI